jgi:2-polyprenyl-3-methyl-5-hydroxy-6-metoxy-1,4-benzoquinol methylase
VNLLEDYDQNTGVSYERWSKTDSVYSLLEWHVFLATIGSVKDLDILDVACGDGRLSRMLMERGARSVVGIDISSEMIARARQENDPGGPVGHFDGLRYETVSARAASAVSLGERSNP